MNIALTVKSGEAWLQDKIDVGITLIEETAAPDTSLMYPLGVVDNSHGAPQMS